MISMQMDFLLRATLVFLTVALVVVVLTLIVLERQGNKEAPPHIPGPRPKKRKR